MRVNFAVGNAVPQQILLSLPRWAAWRMHVRCTRVRITSEPSVAWIYTRGNSVRRHMQRQHIHILQSHILHHSQQWLANLLLFHIPFQCCSTKFNLLCSNYLQILRSALPAGLRFNANDNSINCEPFHRFNYYLLAAPCCVCCYDHLFSIVFLLLLLCVMICCCFVTVSASLARKCNTTTV